MREMNEYGGVDAGVFCENNNYIPVEGSYGDS